MNIDEMPAGCELDALVAEKAMGWMRVHQMDSGDFCGVPPQGAPPYIVPCYSTDIAAAWKIVKKLGFLVMPGDDGTSSLWYVASFDTVNVISSTVKMMPLTICRAALKLMEGKDEH